MFREDRRKKLNDKEKGAIVPLALANASINQIANQIGCSRSTAVLWRNRFAETQDVMRKKGSGRPRATTALQDRAMLNTVADQPITTADEIKGFVLSSWRLFRN